MQREETRWNPQPTCPLERKTKTKTKDHPPNRNPFKSMQATPPTRLSLCFLKEINSLQYSRTESIK
jgi:hypothetical protein